MVDRVERIERIARVRAISDDNKQRYNSGREKRGSFAAELRRAMKSKETVPESAAYDLELTNCGTHSLFYMSGLSLEALLR